MIRVLVVSALAFAVAGLAACAHHHRPAPGTSAACNPTQYQNLVGTPESALDESHLPANHRVVCFGCMATMEYDPTRLTIYIGPGHKVGSVHCS